MAAQQIQFSEAIRAMKLAVRRHEANDSEDSEEESYEHPHTNRGNKLHSSARYLQQGRLNTTGGTAYRKRIKHAGYERTIIAKRPRLYDDEGDIIDPLDYPSDAEYEYGFEGQALKEDPFGQVQIERLLRPLTAASELATHPSLSIAYTSTALNQMIEEAAEMIRRERATLWKAKRLLERLRGDGAWMSCEAFGTAHDALLLAEDQVRMDSTVPSINLDDDLPILAIAEPAPRLGQNHMDDAMSVQEPDPSDGISRQDHEVNNSTAMTNGAEIQEQLNGETSVPSDVPNGTAHEHTNGERDCEQDTSSRSGTNGLPHAMTTRARARSPRHASPTPSLPLSDSASVPAIHPWFIAPITAVSDRDLGLPANEAEETRKLLLMYVQKQENVIRQLDALYAGLQRTDRLRKDVWQACRAEGHMIPDGRGGMQTEMSDGEDWYDPDDWNIAPSDLTKDGMLEKGKDEIEDAAEEEGRRVGGRRRRVVGR